MHLPAGVAVAIAFVPVSRVQLHTLARDRYDRYMAMIGQFDRIRGLEYIRQEGVFTREGQDQIDIVIGYELVDGIHEIEQADKIEFGLEVCEAGLQFILFRLICIGDLDVVLVVHVDNMQTRFKEIEHCFDGSDGNSIVRILEIGEQQDVPG